MDESQEQLNDLVREFCRRAQTYGCDAVQVLLSVHDEKEQQTYVRKYGRGNWYSRQGMAREFLTEDDARTCEVIKQEFEDED